MYICICILPLTDSFIHSKRFRESVTDSKYVLKVLAILGFSETILLFSINVILELPCKCLFVKCGLQVFQNGLVAVLTFNLLKYSPLYSSSLFILTNTLRCFFIIQNIYSFASFICFMFYS